MQALAQLAICYKIYATVLAQRITKRTKTVLTKHEHSLQKGRTSFHLFHILTASASWWKNSVCVPICILLLIVLKHLIQ